MFTRILRILAGLVLIIPGAYLALLSLLIGCTNIGRASTEAPALALFWFWSGMPTSIAEWVVGAIGIVLIGTGYAIATSGTD